MKKILLLLVKKLVLCKKKNKYKYLIFKLVLECLFVAFEYIIYCELFCTIT